MLVSGVVDVQHETVEDLQLWKVERPTRNASPFAQPADARIAATSSVSIIQVDKSGNEVAVQQVQGRAADGSPNVIPFAETIPLTSVTRTIRIRAGRHVFAERTGSANAPVVHLVSPNGGRLTAGMKVQWTASDADKDTLTFALLYSANGGRSWRPLATDLQETTFTLPALSSLPGSTNAVLRVLANDSFYTSFDDSDSPLVVPTSPPVPKILQRDGLSIPFGRKLILTGMATDIDEGMITNSSSFVWSSDRDGRLGAGQELFVQRLSRGVHRITLEVRDAQGKTASTSIRVYVGVGAPTQLTPNVPVAGGND